MENSRPELLSLLPDELVTLMASLGEPAYRARQLFEGCTAGSPPTRYKHRQGHKGKIARRRVIPPARSAQKAGLKA